MKSKLYATLFIAVLFGCQAKENVKTYIPRELKSNESFNEYQHKGADSLSIYNLGTEKTDQVNVGSEKESFRVKFGDTVIQIQSGATDKNLSTSVFSSAQFLNSQKTCILVQAADSTGLVSPFYLITLKNSQLEIVSLYRPSNGKEDIRFTKGASKIGRSGYLINNDFFITTVNAKVYLLKRQNEEERIQGIHFLNSPDRHTLVFLVSSSLYQVHYPTGTVFTQPLSSAVPSQPGAIFVWIQRNFSWQKNVRGISFLKKNPDDDKIINAKDLKPAEKL